MPGDVEMACTPCAPQTPGERLVSACETRDLPGFLAALTDVSVDDPDCVTCLHRTAADPTLAEYLRRLLSHGVDPNTLDQKTKKSPLQIAARNNNAEALHVILRDKRTDVNVLDQFGNTALHLVSMGKGNPDVQARCITLLLAHHQVDANTKNRKGHSAVLLAAKNCPLQVVQALLKHPNIDLDHARDVKGSTARTLIETNFKVLEGQLLPPVEPVEGDKTTTGDDLMRLLYKKEYQRFCELVKGGHGDVNYHDGVYTLLQRACVDGQSEAVSALLNKGQGADPNQTCPVVKVFRPPLHLACALGHADVVQHLLNDGRTRVSARTEEGDTALIQLIRTWGGLKGGYHECLEKLLKHREVNINASNERGDTALYYASITGDRSLVLELLKVGAYIGGANSFNSLPLTNIPRDVMETHLNDCLTSHQSHFDENYRIEFDYSFLVPPGRKPCQGESHTLLNSKTKDCENGDTESIQEDLSSYPETEPLLYMSRKPDLRPLLKHPVLTSFMELKWQRLAPLFRLNIIFYILFVVFITVHILWGNGRNKAGATNTTDDTSLASNPNKPGFECVEWIPLAKNDSLGVNSSTEVDPGPSDTRVTINNTVQVVAIILLVVFTLRELFQFVVSPKRYFSWTNKENYFEILLIISTSLILFRNDLQPYFSAITILLSWGELVLLVGRHPLLSTYIEMLKTVSWNFLKFLAWYAILIVAFALSFYTLFRDSDEKENFFTGPGLSVFKTVVMLTGEFDASDIPFVEFPILSHAVFVLFVFLIAIVLFNLLNGLAVSDTQAIKDDAELVGYVSRVKLVAYIERMVMGHSKRTTWWPSLLSWPVLARRVTLFADTDNVAGQVLPKQGAALWVGPRGEKLESPPSNACSLNCDVIKAAEDVLAMKGRPTDMEHIRKLLEGTEARLADMESHFRGVEKLLQELLNSATDKPTEQ